MHRSVAITAGLLFTASLARAQQLQRHSANSSLATATLTTALASRATTPINVDGRDHEGVWRTAQVIEGFRVFDPVEDGEPSMKTEARVAFDENNVYVLVRAFDPEPSKIMALLSRRDERTQSDYIRVLIDSYHDKR